MKTCCYILAVMVFMVSCNKEHGVCYVRGTVVEEGTSIPIKGTKVSLSEASLFSGRTTEIATTVTDENGNYQINYFKIPKREYRVEFSNPDFILNRVNSNIVKINRYKNVLNFTMIPRAFIKIRYIKKSTTSSWPYLGIRVACGDDLRYLMGPDIPYPLSLQPYDTFSPAMPVLGDRWNELQWDTVYTIGLNQQPYAIRHSLFIRKGDTANFTITFN